MTYTWFELKYSVRYQLNSENLRLDFKHKYLQNQKKNRYEISIFFCKFH